MQALKCLERVLIWTLSRHADQVLGRKIAQSHKVVLAHIQPVDFGRKLD